MEARLRSAAIFRDSAFPLACWRVANHQSCESHSHEFHELVVILAGRGRHVTERETYPIEAGDVFLLRGQMAHGYADMQGMTLVNIIFDPRRLALPLALLRDLPGYFALFQVEPRLRTFTRFRHRLRLPPGDLAVADGLIARLQTELDRRPPGYRFQASAHLMSLIVFLSRCYSESESRTNRPLLHLGHVLSFIEQHYREPITIRQLARLAHMSESTLLRNFRRVLNRSPLEHVIRVRVQQAAALLQQGNLRVTEAAFACGFSDSNYFARQFRQVLGLSPREYRTRHRPADRPSPGERLPAVPATAGCYPGARA